MKLERQRLDVRSTSGAQPNSWKLINHSFHMSILRPSTIFFTLCSHNSSHQDFDDAINALCSTFPKINGWLSWWLRPAFASMIFPACSFVDPAVAEQVPSTSNPAEHQDSLLHHAVGVDQDLIPGAKKLFLHISEIESQYRAIKGEQLRPLISCETWAFILTAGHFDPAPSQKSAHLPHTKKWDENDGRAPHTLDMLHSTTTADEVSNSNNLTSYQWDSPNSCFFDNGLEIWFQAYILWPSAVKRNFLLHVPHESFLGMLIYHYACCLKHIHEPTEAVTIVQNLGLMQSLTCHHIFWKWKLYSSPLENGCAMTWLQHAI